MKNAINKIALILFLGSLAPTIYGSEEKPENNDYLARARAFAAKTAKEIQEKFKPKQTPPLTLTPEEERKEEERQNPKIKEAREWNQKFKQTIVNIITNMLKESEIAKTTRSNLARNNYKDTPDRKGIFTQEATLAQVDQIKFLHDFVQDHKGFFTEQAKEINEWDFLAKKYKKISFDEAFNLCVKNSIINCFDTIKLVLNSMDKRFKERQDKVKNWQNLENQDRQSLKVPFQDNPTRSSWILNHMAPYNIGGTIQNLYTVANTRYRDVMGKELYQQCHEDIELINNRIKVITKIFVVTDKKIEVRQQEYGNVAANLKKQIPLVIEKIQATKVAFDGFWAEAKEAIKTNIKTDNENDSQFIDYKVWSDKLINDLKGPITARLMQLKSNLQTIENKIDKVVYGRLTKEQHHLLKEYYELNDKYEKSQKAYHSAQKRNNRQVKYDIQMEEHAKLACLETQLHLAKFKRSLFSHQKEIDGLRVIINIEDEDVLTTTINDLTQQRNESQREISRKT
jgi:hypothetical protein